MSDPKVKITGIIIELDGKVINLTPEEAKQLQRELNEIFPKEEPYKVTWYPNVCQYSPTGTLDSNITVASGEYKNDDSKI